MNIDINIDSDKINEMVSNAIIDSTIGSSMKKIIKENLKRFEGGYDQPLRDVVKTEMTRIIRDILMEEQYHNMMRNKIKEILASKMSDEFIQKIVDAGFGGKM